MLVSQPQTGFSLIELLIAIAMASLLLVMGIPAFSEWIQNTQTRTAAESVLNGLQVARAEAVSRNTSVRFNLTAADGKVAWTVDCVTVTATCPTGIQVRSANDGGPNGRAGVATATGTLATPLTAGTGLPSGVTFDNYGRVPVANVGTDAARIDVTNALRADARRLVILISAGGQIRMCDPLRSLATSPQGCQ